MCRHIYDWNIVNCDVKQPIYLTLLLLKQKILQLMKLRELYVHIYYYALNNILQNRVVDQLHQAFTFIKTENIAVNEIERIICSHILLRAQ